MTRQLVLQGGFPKSGNFWLYNLLQSIRRHGGLESPSFIRNHPIHPLARTWSLSHADQADIDAISIEQGGCSFRISGVFKEPITDIDAYLRQCSHVWTHSRICERSLDVLPRFDKVVYIVRDPRDVVNSVSHYVFTPHFRDNYPAHHETSPETFRAVVLDQMLRDWVEHVGGHLRHRQRLGIHFVFYERLLHEFRSELAKLLGYLELDLDESAVASIEHEVAFATMSKANPSHVRRGRSGEWEHTLSDAQKRTSERIAGPMLGLLGYAGQGSLPYVPGHDPVALDRAIGQARRSPVEEVRRVVKFATDRRPLRAKAARLGQLVRQRRGQAV